MIEELQSKDEIGVGGRSVMELGPLANLMMMRINLSPVVCLKRGVTMSLLAFQVFGSKKYLKDLIT